MKKWFLAGLCLLVAGLAQASYRPVASRAALVPSAPADSWPPADLDRDGVVDRLDHCPGTTRAADVDDCGCAFSATSDRDLRTVAEYPIGVNAHMRHAVLSRGVIEPDMAFFHTDRAALRPSAQRALLQVAAVIRAYPTLKFEIAGHADSRGSIEHNQKLSERRALEVRRFLMEEGGVRKLQLVARGYGETRLATRERNAEQLQANRRVEFRVVNPEAMPRASRAARPDAMATLMAQSHGGTPRSELVAVR